MLSAGAVLQDPAASFARLQAFLGLPPVEIDLTRYNVRSGYPALDPSTRERLRAYYAPYNEELYELLGEDLGW